MRGINRKIKREIKKGIAFMLVVCMLPLSSFPANMTAETVSAEERKGSVIETVSGADAMAQADIYLDPEIKESSIGDMTVSSNWTLQEDTVVDELILKEGRVDLNGYNLTVCESMIHEAGFLDVDSGNLIIWKDYRMQSRIWDEETESYVYGSSQAGIYEGTSAYMLVAGDIYVDHSSSYSVSWGCGILELKGNLYQKDCGTKNDCSIGNLHFDYSHTLILSGDAKQIVQWHGAEECTYNQIGKIYIRNNSEDGVVFDGAPLICNEIEMTRGQKVTGPIRTYWTVKFVNEYYGGDIVVDKRHDSTYGKVEIDGNLIIEGELGVSENVQVNKDVIIGSKERDEASYLNLYSDGNLYVHGNLDATNAAYNSVFYIGGTAHVVGDVLAGQMQISASDEDARFEIEKNFTMEKEASFSMSGGAKLVFCGDEKQEFYVDEDCWFCLEDIIVENTCEEGVYINRKNFWIESLQTNGNRIFIAENEVIESFTLTEDTTMTGNYHIVGGSIDLNGYTLTCNGNLLLEYTNLNVNGGILYMNGNLYFGSGSYLQMKNKEDRVYVNGKLSFGTSGYDPGRYLTAGKLILYGDLESFYNFKTYDEHVTAIIRKSYTEESMQKIVLKNDSTLTFANLQLNYGIEEHYSCNVDISSIYQNLETYWFDEERPSDVTGLKIDSVDMYDCTISYNPAYDIRGISCYEIWRDGVKIAETDELAYTDSNLKLETEYKYEVYAKNVLGATSKNPSELQVKTKPDLKEPDRVEGLITVNRSGSSIKLQWEESGDNCAVTGYNVYRDGELIAENINEVYYKDTGLEGNTLYSYCVTALDARGNESEKSEFHEEATFMPQIAQTYPLDYKEIGGTTQRMGVIFVYGEKCVSSRVKMEYYDAESETWVVIADNIITNSYLPGSDLPADKSYHCGFYNWGLGSFMGQEDVRVRFTVYDADGNSDSVERTYRLDREIPGAVSGFALEQENGVPTFSWEPLSALDCSGYHIYRREKDAAKYSLLAEIEGYEQQTYADKTGKEGITYEYVIRAYDAFEQEGADSDVLEVTIGPDEEAPALFRMTTNKGTVLSGREHILLAGSDNKKIYRGKIIATNETGGKVEITSGTFDGEDVISIWWDTSQCGDGTYDVTAYLYDEKGNVSNSIERTYKLDNTGPSKVILAKCEITKLKAYLSWENPSDDAVSYAIEKLVGGNWEREQEVKGRLYYEISGLMPETAYSYRVCAYDAYGNRGEVSDIWSFVTEKDMQGPYITSVGPEEGTYINFTSLGMVATDDVKLNYGVFSYSYDGETYHEIKKVYAGNSALYHFMTGWDTSDLPEGEVKVRFEAYDKTGNKNSLVGGEEMERTYYIDHTPPEPVENLVCENDLGSAALTWDKVTAEGYYVYRAVSEEGNYRQIAKVTAEAYTDVQVEEYETYYYKIRAFDKAGNMSEFSAPISVKIGIDELEPKMVSLFPNGQKVYGPDTYVKAIAEDNALLSKVVFEYKEKDEEEWTALGEKRIAGAHGYVSMAWDKSGLKENTEYVIRAMAIDKSGNQSEYMEESFWFDFTAPQMPQLTLEKSDNNLQLQYTQNTEEDFMHYEIYRRNYETEDSFGRIAVTEDATYLDTNVEAGALYLYKVAAVDIYGNRAYSTQKSGYAKSEDVTAPVAVLPDAITGLTGEVVLFDGLLSTDNERIVSYEWDFGDGTKSGMACPRHVYTSPGTYLVEILVNDESGNSSSAQGMVVVSEFADNTGEMVLRVSDTNGSAMAGAKIYVKEKGITLATGSDGKAKLVTESGDYHIVVEADGYRMNEVSVHLAEGSNAPVDVTMYSQKATSATWNITQMTYEEIKAADIDLNDPDNYFSCKYEVILRYEYKKNPSVWISIISDSSKTGGGCISSTCTEVVENPEETPRKAQMVSNGSGCMISLPIKLQSISWLKNMYNASLEVYNISEGDTSLQEVSATISLPEGLSLAKKTSGEQSSEKYIGEIPNEGSRTVEWQVRGDEPGKYEVSAIVAGVFGDTKEAFEQSYQDTLVVEAQHTKGLHLYIRPESKGYQGEDYYVQYELVNESGQTFYQVTTNFGKTRTADRELIIEIIEDGKVVRTERTSSEKSYYLPRTEEAGAIPTLSSGDSVTVGELKPGESITGTYVTKFIGGDLRNYAQLVDAAVKQVEDSNSEITITVEATASHLDKWQVFLPDPADLISYENYSEETIDPTTTSSTEDTEDPVNMMTGEFYTSHNLMTVAGVRNLGFEVNYGSKQTENKGMLGYGWYHAYESQVCDENGLLQLYLNPQDKITFVQESVKENTVRGIYEDGVVTILPEEDADVAYVPLHDYYEDYKLVKNETGYAVTLPDGTENIYDVDGNLIRTTNLQGQSITFEYGENSYTITDAATGKKIQAQMNDGGKITKLTDPAGNTVQFTYDAQENLVAIQNKRGHTSKYAYENHKLTKAWDADGRLYLENTYDEEGKVTTQDDGRAETPLVTFAYTEDEETGNLSVKVNGRNGGEQNIVSDVRGNGLSYTDSVGGVKTYTYDEEGAMLSSTFADGHTESYTYDEAGNLTRIENSATGVQNYTYDENRQITEYRTSGGEHISYTYDENHLLIKQVVNGVITTYTYNEAGQKLTASTEGKGTTSYAYDACGNITEVTYPDGSKDTFTYDAIGNVIGHTGRNGVVTAYEIDPNGHVLSESVTLADGTKAVTSYTYDAYGNVLSRTDAMGNTTTYAYDVDNNCIEEVRANGSKLCYTYDVDGNVTSITYPDGTTTQTAVYDTAGNLKQIVDTLSQITTAEYSSASQLMKTVQADGGVVTYSYFDNGLLKSQTDAEGNTTSYAYDNAGRITSVTDPAGNVTEMAYDAYGNMTSVTDGEGNKVSLSYNAFGEMTSTTDANGNKSTYAYDSMGNCVSTTDALGNVTEYTYDAMGQIAAVTQKGKSGNDITISYAYDNLGNITSVTDGEGNTFRMTYDKVGNVTAIYDAYGQLAESYTYDSVYNQTSVTDGNGAKVSYSYDLMGNKIKTLNESNGSVTTYSYIGGNLINASTDALGGKTSATYDSMGNLASFTNPNGGVTTYTYDKNQNVTSECVGDYYKVTYTYDEVGNVSGMTNSRGQITTYEYDKAGRVIKQSDEAGTITYTYDANGNKLEVTEVMSGDTVSSNTITRTYDALNRVTSYTDAEGNIIEYKYDEFGNITTVTYPDGQKVAYTYDKNGNVLTVTDWEGRITSYSYDKNGRLVKTERPDGSVETRTYDKAGQLLALKDVTKDGVIINDYTYTYDQSGNITAIADQSVGTKDEQTVTDSTVQMEYDAVNRLIKYNGKEVKYDADGNMIYGPLDGEMATFTYDCRNRLVAVTTDSGETTQYVYDAENVRTKVIKNVGTAEETITTYATDSVSNELSRVLEATTVDKEGNTETIRYTYGNGLIAQEKSKDTEERENFAQTEYLLYHFNHLGSTTAVTDEVGIIKYTYTYNIFGNLLSGNYGEVEFLYNGQYGVASDANGLYYMRARYYNIDIMRFINQDILTGSIDSSQSLNRYAYVEGNPVNFLDPFGLSRRSDNADLHDYYDAVGAVSFGIGGVAGILAVGLSGGIAVYAALIATAAAGVGIGATITDYYLYDQDYKNAQNYSQKVEAIDGKTNTVAKSIISLTFKGIGKNVTFKIKSDVTKEVLQFAIEAIGEYINMNL